MSENYFEQVLGGDDADTVDHFIESNPNDVLGLWPQWEICKRQNCQPEKTGAWKPKKMTLYLR